VTAKDFTYSYDYENRLTRVVKVAGSKTTTVTFKYDPFGRRVKKRVAVAQNGQNTVNSYTYVYDKEDVIIDYLTKTVNNGSPTHVVKKYVHGPGIDEPLAVNKGGLLYYYHADGLGSVVALTISTEATVEGYNYDTFGKVERFGNAVKNTYAFTGREYDMETGLYYYRGRYYDPETGRFISKDPIGFAGGDANQYNYVLGDPVNWADLWGLDPFQDLLRDTAAYSGVFATASFLTPGGQVATIVFVGIATGAIGLDTALYSQNPYIDTLREALKMGLPVKKPYDMLTDFVMDLVGKKINGYVGSTNEQSDVVKKKQLCETK